MCGACLSEAPTRCSVSVCHIEGSLKGRGVSVNAILTFVVTIRIYEDGSRAQQIKVSMLL
jgi:hypothetical protein